jgi:hypothetical protein
MMFELDRVDDPLLYDELMRCRQGVRRVNRLRLLAHEGLILQLSLLNGGAMPRGIPAQPADNGQQPTAVDQMSITADVFSEPVQIE